MTKNIPAFIIILLVLLIGVVAQSEPYDMGTSAYQEGHYGEALEILQPLAEQGHGPSQFDLGLMYYRGHGVPQDYKIAAYWSRKSAEQGNMLAQGMIGFMYLTGKGYQQDDTEAFIWLYKAADQGFAEAIAAVGNMYYEGKGTPKDLVQAHKWMNLYSTLSIQSDVQRQASDLKTKIETEMTPAQISEAKRLAVEWFKEFNKESE